MNIFSRILLLVFSFTIIVSCTPEDSNTPPVRDRAEQYVKDIAIMEEFLQTHYLEVINNPGAANDQSVTYKIIPEGGTQTSIWNQTQYPLQTHYVKDNDVLYKIYYLQLRQGSGANSKSPCNVDQVLTSYRGEYIFRATETVDEVEVQTVKSIFFEESIDPQTYFNLTSVIRGWSEIFPLFKTGSYSGNPDGTLSYFNFGAGVMFVPSGLAYFSGSPSGIPAYSPLIFSFKLYELQRTDQDGDGVFSFQEDFGSYTVNSDGTVTVTPGIPDGYVRILDADEDNPDDTDGDKTPDFLDVDDDGDFFTTRIEIRNPLTNNPFAFDLIPTCSDGKKKHLSTLCN